MNRFFTSDIELESSRYVINILLNVEKRYIPKAEYVFRTFCRFLGLKPSFFYNVCYEEVHIYYGPNLYANHPVCIYHNPDAVKFFDEVRRYPDDEINFYQYQDFYLPFLFSLKGVIFEHSENRAIIAKDIITSAFYFLTCWQEYVDEENIIPGDRYDFRQSLQSFWDFTEIPVVDYYCQIFEVSIKHTLKKFSRPKEWKHNARFAMTLSHDIDYFDFWNRKHLQYVYKYNLKKAIGTRNAEIGIRNGGGIVGRACSALYKTAGHFITKHYFYDAERHLRRILEKEERLGCRSTSFLMSQAENLDDRQAYFADNKRLEQIKRIYAGRYVGLHGTKAASFDEDLLLEQTALIKGTGFDVKGYRNHYLSFNYQKSFTLLEQAGFQYDATLGFWEHIGYRAGTSLPFYPFNIKENRPFRVLEIPLTVMDTTLLSEKTMNLSYHKAKSRVFSLIDKTATNHSHISILWHNQNFDCIDHPFWATLYWETIKYAKKQNAWICSLDEMAEFFMY